MTTTMADLVEAVHRNLKLSKQESASVVADCFELIREQLEQGDAVKLSGFGNFTVRQKVSRVGRNPKTGEEFEISARRVVTFKPSQILREKVE
ncbi:MAG: integration host factor subunit alpha [Magnetococcales bacterium]|nr:integration host factor subunit alpha [Magnetococcales bacterium]